MGWVLLADGPPAVGEEASGAEVVGAELAPVSRGIGEGDDASTLGSGDTETGVEVLDLSP